VAITHTYVDYGAGNDTTGDGSIGTPWKTLQKAFDSLTRNTTDGNQVNLKAGTAHVNAAALDLTTFIAGGALTLAAPLIIRGYTSAANDGGMGEIDCGGAQMFAGTYSYLVLVQLKIHNGAAGGNIVNLNSFCTMIACEVVKGTSNSSYGIYGYGSGMFLGCWIHGKIANSLRIGASTIVVGCHIADFTSRGIWTNGACEIRDNILITSGNVNMIPVATSGEINIVGNAFYSTSASTAQGINASAGIYGTVVNNIFVGFSGVGGEGAIYTIRIW